jgi:predicted enzyme related to lactoylglutathione lyase
MTSAAQIDFVEFPVCSGLNADTAHRGPTPLVVLHTVDREQARQNVLAAGGVLAHDIFTFPGGHRFHFTDPAGNEWAVWPPGVKGG